MTRAGLLGAAVTIGFTSIPGGARSGAGRLTRRAPVEPPVHGIHAPRSARPQGQPPLPRHDELRAAHDRGRQPRDHGRALEQGINFFDTANVYGGKKGEGVTEQIIGRWLAQGGGRREKVVLATKVYGEMGDWPNEGRLSALHIRQACEAASGGCRPTTSTCTRCTTSTATTPWEEIWQAMEVLVAAGQGHLRRLAATSPAGTSRGRTRARARRNFLGLVSRAEPVQPDRAHGRAGGAARLPGDTVSASSRGARSPAGCSAACSRRSRQGAAPASTCRARSEQAPRRSSSATKRSARELGESRPTSRSRGCWRSPASPRRSSARARSSSSTAPCARSRSSWTTRRSSALDEIFPGPGGAAPEAYAW